MEVTYPLSEHPFLKVFTLNITYFSETQAIIELAVIGLTARVTK